MAKGEDTMGRGLGDDKGLFPSQHLTYALPVML